MRGLLNKNGRTPFPNPISYNKKPPQKYQLPIDFV